MTDTEELETKFYQPTNDEGVPLGLPIEYTDEKDLREKLRSATQRMKFVVSRGKTKAPENAQRFEGEPDADQIKRDVAEFLRTTPSYHSCPSNFQALGSWIDDNGLQPTLDNFRLAFSTLSRAGLLIDPKGNPTTSDDHTGISYTRPDGTVLYGRKAIDEMPAEEYKRRINAQPGFVDRVERVLASK